MNGFAACISVPALVLLGKFFGDNLEQIKSDVRTVTRLIALGIIVVALVAIGIYLHRRQKTMMASAGVNGEIDAEMLSHLPPGGEAPKPEPDPSNCPSQRADDGTSSTTPAAPVSPAANAAANG